MSGLHQAAAACLAEADPDLKVERGLDLARRWRAGACTLEADAPIRPVAAVGRPSRPALVSPRELPRRGTGGERHLALLHAIAHIEFNAINLAWDAVHRFRGLPRAFYDDWVRVAEEESRHFLALRARLRDLGQDYGDLPAHDGLWQAATLTAGDPLLRMALVPRVLEARGLDVTPGMMARLDAAGDRATVKALEVVLAEEVGHVAAGGRWLRHLCRERGLDPEAAFFDILETRMPRVVRGPFNREARRAAGFSETELRRLEALSR